MKLLFSLLLITCFSIEANCQSIRTSECILLQKSLENDAFNKSFLIDKFTGQTLIVIDTSNSFRNCILQEVNGRKVEIRHELSVKKEKHEIIIDYVKKEKKITTIAFFHSLSNVYLVLELKKKGRKIRVKVKSGGVF